MSCAHCSMTTAGKHQRHCPLYNVLVYYELYDEEPLKVPLRQPKLMKVHGKMTPILNAIVKAGR